MATLPLLKQSVQRSYLMLLAPSAIPKNRVPQTWAKGFTERIGPPVAANGRKRRRATSLIQVQALEPKLELAAHSALLKLSHVTHTR